MKVTSSLVGSWIHETSYGHDASVQDLALLVQETGSAVVCGSEVTSGSEVLSIDPNEVPGSCGKCWQPDRKPEVFKILVKIQYKTSKSVVVLRFLTDM